MNSVDVQDFKFNVFPYHNVFASLLAQIYTLVSNRQIEDAKKLIFVGYLTAAALNRREYQECVKEAQNKDVYQLLYLMIKEQSDAGISPVQVTGKDNFYNLIMKKLNHERKI